jgi:hypothetical protein
MVRYDSAANSTSHLLSSHSYRIFQAVAVSQGDVKLAAMTGDVALIADLIIANPACVHAKDFFGMFVALRAHTSYPPPPLFFFGLSSFLFANRDTYCCCSAPLHYSSSHFGHVDASRFLVECKADVAARDRCSPLAVALLVQRALFPPLSHSLRCSLGRTPLKIAIDNNNSDVVAYLRSIGAPV